MDVIKIENLTKTYGDYAAVNNISFSVKDGEFAAFLGKNGAGKSTTINMMSTLLSPTEGYVEICGYNLYQSNEIRKRIGIVYQENILDELLTVKENLLLRAALYGVSMKTAEQRMFELCSLFSIGKLLSRKYKYLSGGEKRKCEIAAALMHIPAVLFLDEPTTGLDPESRIDVWNTIRKMRKQTKMTVFLTTHYMEEAENADKIIIIHKGMIIADAAPFELKKKYATDYLKIYSDNINERDLIGLQAEKHKNYIIIKLENTVEAIEIINKFKNCINGFEVIQGTLDDAFVNISKDEKL